MRLTLNLSNLHVGGGVQVAASFLKEMRSAGRSRPDLAVLVSSEIEQQVGPLSDISKDVVSLDVYGMRGDEQERAGKILDASDRVFTLFGPLYRWSPPFTSIVGFAQPWIIYPHNEVYSLLPLWERLKQRLKFWVQAQFFKRADVLVVELEHVKAGLVRELGIDPAKIHVVYNCVSSVFHDPEKWEDVTVPGTPGKLRLGFLGRNYPHKNTRIFPELVRYLKQDHAMDATVFVTFTEAEWNACDSEFRDACVNLGPLKVSQCPSFYRELDAVVFPSLLECFSATPLETLAMERPLFASDRPFNRDVCGSYAHYFDPLCPRSAASKIAEVFKAGGPDPEGRAKAKEHAFGFSNAEERARQYLSILEGDTADPGLSYGAENEYNTSIEKDHVT